MTTKKDQELAEVKAAEEKQLSLFANMEADAGEGFDDADRECFAIPFLKLLQKTSPAVDKANDLYIEGAEPGMFFDTATETLIPGEVPLIPVAFMRRFLHWRATFDQGGGFMGGIDVPSFKAMGLTQDEHGLFFAEDGTHYTDVREHFCLAYVGDEWRLVVVPLASTQIKKSRGWLNKMNAVRVAGPNGQKFQPPTYAKIYIARPVKEQYNNNVIYGWHFVPGDLVADPAVYQMAKDFRQSILAGEAKTTDYDGAGSGEDDTDSPVEF